jgi:cell division protein FtsA
MLSLPVRIGKPKGVGGLIDDIINPAFATPVGLILHGAQEEAGSNLGSIGRRVRLSTQGSVSKIVNAIKDLLP